MTKYQLSTALGRPLCGPPWSVRKLKSDEGFGGFPRHLAFYTRGKTTYGDDTPPPPAPPGHLQVCKSDLEPD